MAKAGIDCGTSYMKAAWRSRNGSICHASSQELYAHDMMRRMAADGVTSVRLTGIGPRPPLDGLFMEVVAQHQIADEKRLQAMGARLLTDRCPERFLCVGIGTGTSYVGVSGDAVEPFTLGSGIGGGFIAGIAGLCRIPFTDVAARAARGKPLDILAGEVCPEFAGTPSGAFIISHFGRAFPNAASEDICATLVRMVAATVCRDIFQFQQMGKAFADVVVVGTPASSNRRLREDLTFFADHIDVKFHFPSRGEFATARGALAEIE